MLLLGILCSVLIHQETPHSVEHCLTAVYSAALSCAGVQYETQILNTGSRQYCIVINVLQSSNSVLSCC